jgi:hypothetical protein
MIVIIGDFLKLGPAPDTCTVIPLRPIFIGINDKRQYITFYYSYSGDSSQSVAFWGVVSNALSNDGHTKLPAEDDKQVASLTNVMFVFFIVAIVLLVVYVTCSILLIYGAVNVL